MDVGKRKLLRWNDVGGKRLAVLGEGLKPSTSRALYYYNHYENGGGWWDDRREGVDDEEVGSKAEAWEGFGTATL
ncbi:hypothetical protein M569_00646 [Genlisea aurea]|uniref:Uncharacterized protein n=1 Tax=Genlisea aurea TaxID=192259 RepID=S8EMZ5_9LAMI|nr:hypothetical protein M569_00646 [Genlisea aurea]